VPVSRVAASQQDPLRIVLRTKPPVGLSTRMNSAERTRNHSTILFTLPRPIMRSLCALCPTAGSIVAGIAASTITGQMPLTVGVMLAGTLGARWAHDRDDHRPRATVHG
jgi:hypothetical protein